MEHYQTTCTLLYCHLPLARVLCHILMFHVLQCWQGHFFEKKIIGHSCSAIVVTPTIIYNESKLYWGILTCPGVSAWPQWVTDSKLYHCPYFTVGKHHNDSLMSSYCLVSTFGWRTCTGNSFIHGHTWMLKNTRLSAYIHTSPSFSTHTHAQDTRTHTYTAPPTITAHTTPRRQ